MGNIFNDDGEIRDDLNIHDKSIPCIYRLGFAMKHFGPCEYCVYKGVCYTDDMGKKKERMAEIKKDYPQLFDGTIQTRWQYIRDVLNIY